VRRFPCPNRGKTAGPRSHSRGAGNGSIRPGAKFETSGKRRTEIGPVAGEITIASRIEPLQLVAFKRRALGLVVIELISDALLHEFSEFEAGHIEV
jgi:hypothetical protein